MRGSGRMANGCCVSMPRRRRPRAGVRVPPLAEYLLAEFAEQQGLAEAAAAKRRAAVAASSERVFPFEMELAAVLRRAMAADPRDARAPYSGNLLFDGQPGEAMAAWQRSVEIDPSLPVVHRNLAVAWSRQKPSPDLERAVASLECAVTLPQPLARHFTELDEFHEATGTAPATRLALLERHADTVARRDDAQARFVALLVWAGRYDEAIVQPDAPSPCGREPA